MSKMAKYTDPIELDAEIDPWEQQPDESDEHYTAFEIYRGLTPHADPETGVLGQRRLSEMYARVPQAPRTVRMLARRFCWVERARAFDLSEDGGVAGELEFNRRVVLRNRLNQLAEVDRLVLEVLRRMSEDVESWKPRDLAALWEVAVKVGDGLLGMTRLGGPQTAGIALGARAEVAVHGVAELEAQTVELVDELRRRGLAGSGLTSIEGTSETD